MTATERAYGRTPINQAKANAENALRALEFVPRAYSDLVPHPLDVVANELRQTIRFLTLETEH